MVHPDSPGRLDHTESLPPELILYLLSVFTFEELLPLLAVSRRWRAIALDSEPYWSFIRLGTLTDAAVSLFVIRVSRTNGRPFDLNLNVRLAVQDASALQATVLSALRAHLHHVNWLLVNLRDSDALALWSALDVAAPLLCYLGLQCDILPANGSLPVVPADLFAGDAPVLRSVSLVDVVLPVQALSVFSKVSKFTTDYTAVRAVPDIFHHFPALEIIDFPCDGTFEHPAFHTPHSYLKVTDCVWRSGRGLHTIPLPLASARGVHFQTIYNPRPEEIHDILEPLQAPLRLIYGPSIEYPEDDFELFISEFDGPSPRRRVIVDGTQVWSEKKRSDLRRALATALGGKLHFLSVDAPDWASLVRCIPSLPGLPLLQITISEESEVAELTHTRFPSRDFRVLELAAPRCMLITEQDIAAFVTAVFDPIALRETTLFLVNIHLSGGPRTLRKMFKKTHIFHKAPCRRRRPLAQA